MNKAKTKSTTEKYAERWFKENGFEVISIKQYCSKTEYLVRKDDIATKIELPFGLTEIKRFMQLFEEDFERQKELLVLRAQVKEKKKNAKENCYG